MAVIAIGMINPVLQFIDGNGAPYAGGSVTFYATGTLNLQNVYSDAGRTTLLTTPVSLNAAGRSSTSTTGPDTGVYYLSANYDYVLKDANGVTIFGPITFSGGSLTNSNNLTYIAKTANYTAVAGDLVAATTGTFTVTLPVASSNVNSTIAVVNNGTGTITVGRSASDTIGLATTQTLNPGASSAYQGDSMTFHSDGTSNWIIL